MPHECLAVRKQECSATLKGDKLDVHGTGAQTNAEQRDSTSKCEGFCTSLVLGNFLLQKLTLVILRAIALHTLPWSTLGCISFGSNRYAASRVWRGSDLVWIACVNEVIASV